MSRRLRSARRRFYKAMAEDQKQVMERLSTITPEQVAECMEQLPTDVLEWAVKFEILSHTREGK